jgi:methyl-accepting chemotaxis protein
MKFGLVHKVVLPCVGLSVLIVLWSAFTGLVILSGGGKANQLGFNQGGSGPGWSLLGLSGLACASGAGVFVLLKKVVIDPVRSANSGLTALVCGGPAPEGGYRSSDEIGSIHDGLRGLGGELAASISTTKKVTSLLLEKGQALAVASGQAMSGAEEISASMEGARARILDQEGALRDSIDASTALTEAMTRLLGVLDQQSQAIGDSASAIRHVMDSVNQISLDIGNARQGYSSMTRRVEEGCGKLSQLRAVSERSRSNSESLMTATNGVIVMTGQTNSAL